MNSQPTVVPPPTLNLGDIYYVLFRHKWKILLCLLTGAAAALAVQRFNPPPYQSEAKLFVRYVMADKAIAPASADTTAKSPDQRGETIMNSETEILTSVDLARQVAEAIGPDKILARLGGGKDTFLAIAAIKRNLSVIVAPASSVMHVSFKHPDPELVQPILREIIDRYLKLHVETHTANGMLGDFLTQETDQLRARLAQTEEELRKATAKAGVITLEDAKRAYAEQITAIQKELFATEADLAQRTSALEELAKRLPASATPPLVGDAPIPPEILDEYRSNALQIQLLQRMEQELLTQFTPESPRVVEVHTQLTAADQQRAKLLERYPRIAQLGVVTERGTNPDATLAANLATETAALKAKAKVLNAQMSAVRTEATRLEQMEGTITELRRKKDLEEANYRYYSASLEQSRINEALGNGHISNIIQIQKPSPPFSDHAKTNKLMGVILASGLGLGLAWAFFIELYFDRSIKRAIDLERNVPAPLLLSIPALSRRQLKLAGVASRPNGHGPALPPAGGPLAAYHDTLRDRLIGYFESINLNHKPKLVAVAGLGRGTGVTTTAAGLARSLSETGEGNVLLVDMNANQGAAQQFTKGEAVCGLDDILQAPNNAHVEPNLYLVAEHSHSDRLSRNMPQRFTKLVPKLKASDFDYIIFDMPPVTQISITPRLAGFMDIVVLVIESEKTDRDLTQRAVRMLAETRAHVGVLLNKTRRYVPTRLHEPALAT